MLAAFTVFSERRARRSELIARAGFTALMDATGFGVLMVNSAGQISYANSTAIALLGYPESALIGRDKHALLHQADPSEQGECPLQRALRERRTYFGTESFLDIQGRRIPVTVSSAPVLLQDGGGQILVFRDRTADEAEARRREETFALISHELRSPLTTVVGFSNRLHRAVQSGRLPMDEQRTEEIALLASEAARMRDIVTVVLDVANLDRRIEIQPEPVSVRRVLEDEIERMQREHPLAPFVLFCEHESVVESDERYVRRIMQNLMENAVKYGGTDHDIDVIARSTDDGVAIAVRDRGPGIPLEAQARVFERFYRQETTAGRRPGLGLGLYLSRRLANRLGGTLTFESEPGNGTTFTLWLPMEAPETDEQWESDEASRREAMQLGDQLERVERLID